MHTNGFVALGQFKAYVVSDRDTIVGEVSVDLLLQNKPLNAVC